MTYVGCLRQLVEAFWARLRGEVFAYHNDREDAGKISCERFISRIAADKQNWAATLEFNFLENVDYIAIQLTFKERYIAMTLLTTAA